jgi:hypothetical protein
VPRTSHHQLSVSSWSHASIGFECDISRSGEYVIQQLTVSLTKDYQRLVCHLIYFFSRRLRDVETVISRVSENWYQQRQKLSSEQRRKMRIRHSPIVEQVTFLFGIRQFANSWTAEQVQRICIVTHNEGPFPTCVRQSVPPLFDSCTLVPSSMKAVRHLRAAHAAWLQERGVIIAAAPVSSMASQ